VAINTFELVKALQNAPALYPNINYFRALVKQFTPNTANILELGAGSSPLFNKLEFPGYKTLDYYSTEELKLHYQHDYKINNIHEMNFPEVDYVCKDGRLKNCIENQTLFDLVFSSHNLEHHPCLLSHLNEVESLLHPNSVAAIIVPDKRCTFDMVRSISMTADVIDRYFNPQNVSLRSFLDYTLRATDLNPIRRISAQDEYQICLNLDDALSKYKAGLIGNLEFVDFHNWVFTPESLHLILLELYQMKLTRLYPQLVTETLGNEFMCIITLLDPDTQNFDHLNTLRKQLLTEIYLN
jgi:SAM-dependent methyltransferase